MGLRRRIRSRRPWRWSTRPSCSLRTAGACGAGLGRAQGTAGGAVQRERSNVRAAGDTRAVKHGVKGAHCIRENWQRHATEGAGWEERAPRLTPRGGSTPQSGCARGGY